MALELIRKDICLIDDILDETSYGQEAIDMFRAQLDTEEPYVLIFMDCSMEPMDGYTACRTIKAICQERGVDAPYIVATTGHSEEEYIQKAWRNGMDELIPKPCRPKELSLVLEESLQFQK